MGTRASATLWWPVRPSFVYPFVTDVERATVATIKRGVDFQPGEVLQMTVSLFGGHAKRIGAHTDVGRPMVSAVITSRKVLVDDCHEEPRRFLLS